MRTSRLLTAALVAGLLLVGPHGTRAQAPDEDDPLATATPEMRRILEEYRALDIRPVDTLTPAQARQQPTRVDVVKSLLAKQGKAPPASTVTSRDMAYTGPGGSQLLRLYSPAGVAAGAPLILYFHGGGWVIGDVASADTAPMALASQTGALVVSAEYRHAPEHKFPAAHDDAFAAYEWLLKNAAGFGADPKRIAVVGEDAGGNLAAHVSLRARDTKTQMPVYQVLIHPIAGSDMSGYSYNHFETAQPLGKAQMKWFLAQAFNAKDLGDKRLNIGNSELANLPRTTIITAQIDPLMFEGKLLGHKLESTNVPTRFMNYEGVTHDFFAMAPVLREARQAQALAAEQLVAAFETAAKKK